MQKVKGQLCFADGLVQVSGNFLSEIDEMIDWHPLEQALQGIYASSTGRPSYPLLVLFKTLLLQQWYGLSDPATEEALSDRISFRRFAGLNLSDAVPDHSTISRFRAKLGDRFTRLFDTLNAQLGQRGFMVKEGTMLDASFVKSVSPNETVDPEAGKYGPSVEGRVCGYKMHAGVDKGSGLVRRIIVTPANINDTVIADELVMGDEKAIYADKAYDTRARRRRLTERGIFAGLMHRPGATRPLTAEQVAFNSRMTKLRAPVERTFATLKLYYRLRRSRYVGQIKTAVQVTLACMAMNMKRALVLAKT